MKGWSDVYKKELREFARDKRVLYTALVGPVLLEVFLIFIFGFIGESLGKEGGQKIMVINRAEGAAILKPMEKLFAITEAPESADVDQLLKDGKARLILRFPKGFAKAYAEQSAPSLEAIYDPNETTSEIALGKAKLVMQATLEMQRTQRIQAMKLDPKRLEAFTIEEKKANTGKAFAGAWLVGFLPYLIVIWAFYGGFSIVSDLVAGEKERGTLETLLVSPISRTAIAIGKFAALATLSFVGCTSALLGVVIMAVSNLPITRKLFEDGLSMSGFSIVAIVVTLLPLVVFFAASLLALSTMARNQREVQGYLSLASFVVLIPALMSQFIGYTEAATAKWIAFVPVLNTATVIRQAILDKVDWYNLLVTAGVSTLLAVVCLRLAVAMFNRESVLLRV
jgi:sodium transport system permease protein